MNLNLKTDFNTNTKFKVRGAKNKKEIQQKRNVHENLITVNKMKTRIINE